MAILRWLREVLHRRYVRAGAVGVSLVVSLCSTAVLLLSIEHRVPATAVVRYFSRPHLDAADLAPLLRDSESGRQLEVLLRTEDGLSPGGMVYASDGRLTFHPHARPELAARWRNEGENRLLYARLVPLYHRRELGALLAALSTTEVRSVLAARGVDASALAMLAERLPSVDSEAAETRLLRRAASFIQPLTPQGLAPAWLDLGEKLRFYAAPAPSGRFVGQYAVLDGGWAPRLDESEALDLSRHSHYLLITHVGERILLLDFYRGSARRYDLTPFDHLSGNRLYRLAVAG